jgi:hypothetical protein
MKATLEFDLDAVDDTGDRRRLDLCLRAETMHELLRELDERLRTRAQHTLLSLATINEIQEFRTWLEREAHDREIPWE